MKKADLENNWVSLCLMPHRVNEAMRDKFVACLLGDEEMTDAEFNQTFAGCPSGRGCEFCFEGACSHPFRPGSLVGMIFASCLGDQKNAKELVNENDKRHLETRRCYGCTECFSSQRLLDGPFRGIQQFYERLFDEAEHDYHTIDWDDFRNRGWGCYFDGCKFFPDGGMYYPYEENVRKHFLDMMRADFDELAAVMNEKRDYTKYKERKAKIEKCVAGIKFRLITHFMNYWEKEGYKNV